MLRISLQNTDIETKLSGSILLEIGRNTCEVSRVNVRIFGIMKWKGSKKIYDRPIISHTFPILSACKLTHGRYRLPFNYDHLGKVPPTLKPVYMDKGWLSILYKVEVSCFINGYHSKCELPFRILPKAVPVPAYGYKQLNEVKSLVHRGDVHTVELQLSRTYYCIGDTLNTRISLNTHSSIKKITAKLVQRISTVLCSDERIISIAEMKPEKANNCSTEFSIPIINLSSTISSNQLEISYKLLLTACTSSGDILTKVPITITSKQSLDDTAMYAPTVGSSAKVPFLISFSDDKIKIPKCFCCLQKNYSEEYAMADSTEC
ncbi:unnamed protein product [Dimorphilus gyrociliatus]|uniref:Arrestin C-terminal-like domain-containing protein n=1 Tax=Dimorphilus gyrociliatus TaxID=2664684 RepID=A0A7I8VVC7_9ANNE|nr:unnamed protein product [Dimorphilus gyrociliatus]